MKATRRCRAYRNRKSKIDARQIGSQRYGTGIVQLNVEADDVGFETSEDKKPS